MNFNLIGKYSWRISEDQEMVQQLVSKLFHSFKSSQIENALLLLSTPISHVCVFCCCYSTIAR
ncbi:CLUMA_CG006707, isoform A [Clunio marinus]|uniref:CLUMA_CG006707, isoform A n=1 Tax=Clunio marinus TaxID=568069 RepID=A0A1J1HYX9_9DIPT|nr:CLUMA_CG006707, isoform A [Clunio marinus]